MSQFLREVALKVAVAWLSPSAVFFAGAGYLVWHNQRQISLAVTNITAPCGQGQACGIITKASDGLDTILAESRNVTIALVDKGRPGKPETMGLIPAARYVAMQTGQAVGNSTKVTDAAASGMNTLVQHAVPVMDAAHTAIGDVAELASQGRTDLQTLNGTIRQAQALTEAYTRSGDDLDALLRENQTRIASTLDNVNGLAFQAKGVTTDLHAETTRLFNPVPCSKTAHPTRCHWARFGKGFAAWVGIAGRAGQAALPVVLH